MSFVVPELARQHFTDVERTAALFAAHAVVADEGPAHRRLRGDSSVDRSDVRDVPPTATPERVDQR